MAAAMNHAFQMFENHRLPPQNTVLDNIFAAMDQSYSCLGKRPRQYSLPDSPTLMADVYMSKGKALKDLKAKPKIAKDKRKDACRHCREIGHWKRNCPLYLSTKKKKQKQNHPLSTKKDKKKHEDAPAPAPASGSLLKGGVCTHPTTVIGALLKGGVCTHPTTVKGLCEQCGEKVAKKRGGFPFTYLCRGVSDTMFSQLRDTELSTLFRNKKLYLVLDLDHTLLNSSPLTQLTKEENSDLNVLPNDLPDSLKGSLHKLDHLKMITKLRPYVHSFLKEASKMFELYIYTMGEREYALEMAKLLDPQDIYFSSVLSRGDSVNKDQKALDHFLGLENFVLILDDTQAVWSSKHRDNLLVMDRYNFFATSCQQFGLKCKSLSQQRRDEHETCGALASVLNVLQQIHASFYDSDEHKENLMNRDVRQVARGDRQSWW